MEEKIMTDMEYLTPKSPKVIALYNAVIALLREGADLTRLKVSDIAAEAGIGKGTTYDYFKSREELIVKAILYRIYRDFQEICRRIEQAEDFRSKIDIFLDLVFETGCPDKKLFEQYMQFCTNSRSLPLRFREELLKCAFPIEEIRDFGKLLYEYAAEEGIVPKGLSLYYIQTAFLNLMLSYALYCHPHPCAKQEDVLTKEDVKQRLYENLVYMLR
ncbi:MAG: TetR/AcrR family transcriptional regulator [Lachnospiraceae bacterium]|nr:TetR/AcrR family transcriptional regulator [Lachnospiraceae bacterium]